MFYTIFTDATTTSVSNADPTTGTLTTGSRQVYPGGYVITLAAISTIRISTLII
jgi:hypothetical protein